MHLDQLRALVAAAPQGTGVSLLLPADELREALAALDADTREDLTAAEVAALPQVRATAATVRRWANAGRFAKRAPDCAWGAHRLPSGEWRFPRRCVEDLLDRLAQHSPYSDSVHNESVAAPARRGRRSKLKLGSWREVHREPEEARDEALREKRQMVG